MESPQTLSPYEVLKGIQDVVYGTTTPADRRLKDWIKTYSKFLTNEPNKPLFEQRLQELNQAIERECQVSLLNPNYLKTKLLEVSERVRTKVEFEIQGLLNSDWGKFLHVLPFLGIMIQSLTKKEYDQLPTGVAKLKMFPSLEALLRIRNPALNIEISCNFSSDVKNRLKENMEKNLSQMKADVDRSGIPNYLFNETTTHKLLSFAWWSSEIFNPSVIDYLQGINFFIGLFQVVVQSNEDVCLNLTHRRSQQASRQQQLYNQMCTYYLHENKTSVFKTPQQQDYANRIIKWWNDMIWFSGKSLLQQGVPPLLVAKLMGETVYHATFLLSIELSFLKVLSGYQNTYFISKENNLPSVKVCKKLMTSYKVLVEELLQQQTFAQVNSFLTKKIWKQHYSFSLDDKHLTIAIFKSIERLFAQNVFEEEYSKFMKNIDFYQYVRMLGLENYCLFVASNVDNFNDDIVEGIFGLRPDFDLRQRLLDFGSLHSNQQNISFMILIGTIIILFL